MESVTTNQLDYKKYQLQYSSYQYTKCLPVSGGNSYSVSAAGTEILIELPVRAMNLCRSILYFQLYVLDAGAAGQPANNLQLWFPADCLALIRQMQLYTRSNTFVADIYELQNYTQVVWKGETKQINYLTFDQAVNGGAGQGSVPSSVNNSGFARFLQPSTLIMNGLANHRHDNSLPQMQTFENLHFYAINAVTNGANAGAFILNCEIPLAMKIFKCLHLRK